MAALRFRFAPLATGRDAGGDNALTIRPDHSVWADHSHPGQFSMEILGHFAVAISKQKADLLSVAPGTGCVP